MPKKKLTTVTPMRVAKLNPIPMENQTRKYLQKLKEKLLLQQTKIFPKKEKRKSKEKGTT